jgi:hypothetical protein
MIIGFTGTQQGMTVKQAIKFVAIIQALKPIEFHHGDCIGADAEAHDLIRGENQPICIILHPPTSKSKRAFKDADKVYEAKPYIERNHDIVDVCDKLIACPKDIEEELRSGTWATARYALKCRKKVYIIHPDGSFESK